MTLVKKIATLA